VSNLIDMSVHVRSNKRMLKYRAAMKGVMDKGHLVDSVSLRR